MKIYLVGLPGSGKSLLGKELAEAMSVPFIDLDTEIEKEEGLSVADIFIDKGESYFRTVEAEMLRNSSTPTEFVMATGGGAPCFHSNMDFINQAGISVFMNTPVETIASRLTASEKQTRPLLKPVSDDRLIQKLKDLLQKRIEYYQQAHFMIDTPALNAKDIIKLIKEK